MHTLNCLIEHLEEEELRVEHHNSITKEDPQYDGRSYNVMVEWEMGETSYEPLSLIA